MAKVIKRIGTLAQKFSVDVTVHSLRMTLSVPVLVNLIWKRKKRRVESRKRPPMPANSKGIEVEETLTMINTMYQKKSGEFLEKKAVITFQAVVEGRGSKVVGSVTLNIAQYLSGLNQQEFRIDKCPDKNATAVLSLRAQAMGELVEADNVSEMSGGTGFSMGTEDVGGFLSEQDLTGFEEEVHPNPAKVMIAGNIRPAIPRAPAGRPGPVKPVHTLDTTAVQDLKAQLALLEREKSELQSEKDDLKKQCLSLVDSSRREKEDLIHHIQ